MARSKLSKLLPPVVSVEKDELEDRVRDSARVGVLKGCGTKCRVGLTMLGSKEGFRGHRRRILEEERAKAY